MDTVEQMGARLLSRRLDDIIGRVSELARDLRLIQTRIDTGPDDRETYARLAAQAQQAVVDMLFNAGVHALAQDAYVADCARARRVAAETIAASIDAEAAKVRLSGDRPVRDAALAECVGVGARVAREYAAREG
jgi:hypothetical protein